MCRVICKLWGWGKLEGQDQECQRQNEEPVGLAQRTPDDEGSDEHEEEEKADIAATIGGAQGGRLTGGGVRGYNGVSMVQSSENPKP